MIMMMMMMMMMMIAVIQPAHLAKDSKSNLTLIPIY